MKRSERNKRTDLVRIRVLVPMAGQPRWDEYFPIEGETSLLRLFSTIENPLGKALKEELLDKGQPPYLLLVNGIKVRSNDFINITLRGGDELIIFALLIGG
jgi:hypothetical protein